MTVIGKMNEYWTPPCEQNFPGRLFNLFNYHLFHLDCILSSNTLVNNLHKNAFQNIYKYTSLQNAHYSVWTLFKNGSQNIFCIQI